MDPADIALAFALLFVSGGGVYVAVMIARAAVTRWMGPKSADPTEMSQLRDEVQRLAVEVSDVHQLMTELQERVDFAERMLAKQKQPTALPEH